MRTINAHIDEHGPQLVAALATIVQRAESNVRPEVQAPGTNQRRY
jgi:hypothetical protein